MCPILGKECKEYEISKPFYVTRKMTMNRNFEVKCVFGLIIVFSLWGCDAHLFGPVIAPGTDISGTWETNEISLSSSPAVTTIIRFVVSPSSDAIMYINFGPEHNPDAEVFIEDGRFDYRASYRHFRGAFRTETVAEGEITLSSNFGDYYFTRMITVTWSASLISGNMVLYRGNDNTGGIAPFDYYLYDQGATVTVESAGGLYKTGYIFETWNTQPDGKGDDYLPGSTFTMGTLPVILYAKWAQS